MNVNHCLNCFLCKYLYTENQYWTASIGQIIIKWIPFQVWLLLNCSINFSFSKFEMKIYISRHLSQWLMTSSNFNLLGEIVEMGHHQLCQLFRLNTVTDNYPPSSGRADDWLSKGSFPPSSVFQKGTAVRMKSSMFSLSFLFLVFFWYYINFSIGELLSRLSVIRTGSSSH